MSLLTRKRLLLAKAETVYGTDPVPTGSNAMLVANLSFNPLQADLVARSIERPYFGNPEQLIATKSAQVSFEIEMVGSGVAGTAPSYDCLLQACAFGKTVVASTSVTYAPITSSLKSVTLYVSVDGVLHVIKGARGTVEVGVNVKQIPVFKFSFTGLYTPPSDTAQPTPDYSGFVLPEIANTSNTPGFTLDGYSGNLESFSFNMANDVQYRSLIGSESVLILDRKPAGTLVFEAPTITAKDFFTLAAGTSLVAMTLTHGSTAGHIVQISAPKVKLGNPTYQDSSGVQMLSAPFTASPNTGNDEVSIIFT